MKTDTPNPYQELDEIRSIVKQYPDLQKAIQDAALHLFDELRKAYPVVDKYGEHTEIPEPVKFAVKGIDAIAYALNPRQPTQIWLGFHVIMVDAKTGLPDRNATLMIYRRVGPPEVYEWRILKPGTEAELSKKIVGRSRLYYYPDGDSKTRGAME